uniref:NADH-ubiquinone oxidoreductase chain 3 n=1 Tax=Sinosolenaia oleivora TaxID=3237505 RepID=A0A3G1GHD2_9BIVA|nr:NADH dehydrogenase subunit 3 [Solenaia oleivora]
MKAVIVCGVLCAVVVIIVLIFGWVVSSCWFSDMRDLSSPFECGFDPFGSSRVGFSLRFFMVMILFIVFDFETVLLMPFVFWLGEGCTSSCGVFSLVGFLLVLLVGVVYEMGKGGLEWGS